MSNNKAVAYDGLSDRIFTMKGVGKVMKNIWNCDFPDTVYNETKLVALNKLYPKIPGPKDFRPINIMPQGIKLKEARFAGKLYHYCTKKLFRGQTGFVPNMGCLVNQTRAINRIKLRTENNSRQIVYGLFIDFSSAYNTILHSKLYERLQAVMGINEVEYLKALYSRNKIRLGEHSFTPNIGVAQGSIISPALFNVYLEDLLKKIEAYGVNMEDILAYADDVLVLCTSIHELRKVIEIVRKWSSENNLKLNEKKSGIVPFQPRKGKQKYFTLKPGNPNNPLEEKTFEGFPVLQKYKYLGLWLDEKLQMKNQIQHIKQKTNYISHKLYPMIYHCSLETRINLWDLMCRPLIEQTFALFEAEQSRSNQEALLRIVRTTFRRMTLLSNKVENTTIEKFLNYDFIENCRKAVAIAREKWRIRTGKNQSDKSKEEIQVKPKKRNMMPKELVRYTNLLTAKCNQCPGKIIRVQHLKQSHDLDVPDAVELWEELAKIEQVQHKYDERKGKWITKVLRKETIEKRAEVVRNYIEKIHNMLNKPV